MQATANTNTQEIIPTDLSEFVTKKGLCREYPDLINESRLDWLLRFREENGFNEAVRKLGRTLVIHKPTFVRILMSRR
jgi:hypothetical protein